MPLAKFVIVLKPASSTALNRLVEAVKLGASFTATTVTTNEFVLLEVPSLAISVFVEVPKALVTVVIVRSRLVPLPLRLTEIKFVFEVLAVNVTFVMSPSTSLTVKGKFVLPTSS